MGPASWAAMPAQGFAFRLLLLPRPQMRDVVRSVAKLFPTAIISGRGREKVENFVKLSELYYAGSHGMDIAGPSVSGLGQGLCRGQAGAPHPVQAICTEACCLPCSG